jgi:hypothetical protein
MSAEEVRSPGLTTSAGRERTRVLVLAGLIVGAIGFYVAFGASDGSRDSQRNLLPYQTLARTLSESEQQVFTAIRRGLLDVEAERSRLSRWPDPSTLAAAGRASFEKGGNLTWHRFLQGAIVNYVGLPTDAAAPAWMLAIQEPEPNTPPDPSPLDDEHHRLPDGTTLHVYVWMHRYGGRITAAFVPQPQAAGWTEIFSVPPNPVLPSRT